MKDIENGMLCDWFWRDFERMGRYGERQDENEEYEDTDFDSEATLPARTARVGAGAVEDSEVEA